MECSPVSVRGHLIGFKINGAAAICGNKLLDNDTVLCFPRRAVEEQVRKYDV